MPAGLAALTLPKVESEPCAKASGIFSGFPNDSTSHPLTMESCREQKHRTVTESSGFRGALGGDQHKLCFLLTGMPPHTSDYRNLRERQCQACTSTASPYWNTCQHTLACAHTWLNYIHTTKKLNHRRAFQGGKGSCCFTTARGRLQTVSGAMKCAFQQHTQAGSPISLSKFLVQNSVDQAGLEFRDLLPLPPSTPPCLRWVYILKHHYLMCTQTGRAPAGGMEGPGPGPSPLERHRAWQVRKAGRAACAVRGEAGAAVLWLRPLHHHLVQMPRRSCMCVKGTHTSHTAFCGSQSQTSSHCSKWDTSGTVRGTVAEGSANEPRAPLLHHRGPWSPGHWLFIKSEEKIYLSQPHSFGHYHYKANRNKVIHELWAVSPSVLSPLPLEVGEAGPQELLLELMVSFFFLFYKSKND